MRNKQSSILGQFHCDGCTCVAIVAISKKFEDDYAKHGNEDVFCCSEREIAAFIVCFCMAENLN